MDGLEDGLKMAGSAVDGYAKTASGRGALWFGRPTSRWTTVAWVAFTLAVCLHFSLTYNTESDFLNLDAYMRGVENTPYQYRILMMWVFRLFATNHVVLGVAQRTHHMHAPVQFQRPQQLVQIGVAMLSLFGAVLATAGTLTRLTGDKVFSRWISLLLIYMAYADLAPGWGLAYTLPYDVPSLMFFCVGVYLVVTGRNWLYYAMYPIAVLNRETICFLTVFFLVWKWKELRARKGNVSSREVLRLAAHGLAQAAIWIGLKLWLAHKFMGNVYDYPTIVTRPRFLGRVELNFHMLVRPQQWPVYLSVFGFLLPVLWLQRRWIQSEGIYWSCKILLPLWFAGMFCMGLLPEIRVFSELSAVLVPALGLIVYHRFAPVASDRYSQLQLR